MANWSDGSGVVTLRARDGQLDDALRKAQQLARQFEPGFDSGSEAVLAAGFRKYPGGRGRVECVCGTRLDNKPLLKAHHAEHCAVLRRLDSLAESAHKRARRNR